MLVSLQHLSKHKFYDLLALLAPQRLTVPVMAIDDKSLYTGGKCVTDRCPSRQFADGQQQGSRK